MNKKTVEAKPAEPKGPAAPAPGPTAYPVPHVPFEVTPAELVLVATAIATQYRGDGPFGCAEYVGDRRARLSRREADGADHRYIVELPEVIRIRLIEKVD